MSDRARRVKCVVWDLDDTLWNGILAEGDSVVLRPEVPGILAALDERGILNSIASKNEPDRALARLRDLGVADFFLYPKVSWRPKSELVADISRDLNIGLDTILLLDDSPFERDEVRHAHRQVRCVDPASLDGFLDRPEFDVAVTPEARARRLLYQQAATRRAYEDSFSGPRGEFLASLDMKLTITRATAEGLARAAELTERTHQLNTTGLTFSAEELAALMRRDDQILLLVSLADRYGSYGVIGVALVGTSSVEWRIRLFLMSCRVMGRNVGGAVLAYLARCADALGVDLTADFLANDVNRPMYMVYRLAGFIDAGGGDDGGGDDGGGDDGGAAGVRRLRLKPGAARQHPDHLDLAAPPVESY